MNNGSGVKSIALDSALATELTIPIEFSRPAFPLETDSLLFPLDMRACPSTSLRINLASHESGFNKFKQYFTEDWYLQSATYYRDQFFWIWYHNRKIK